MISPRDISNIGKSSIEPFDWSNFGLSDRSHNGDMADRIGRDLRALCSSWPLVLGIKLAGILFYILAAPAGPLSIGTTTVALAALSISTDLCIWAVAKRGWFANRQSRWQLVLIMLAASISAISFAGASMSAMNVADSPLLAAYCVIYQCLITLIMAIIAGKQRAILLSFSTGVAVALYPLLPLATFSAALLIFLAASFYATLQQNRHDHHEYLRVESTRRDEERAKLLLSEYENASLGWFWETDRHGKIVYISDTIGKYALDTFDDLMNLPLTQLVAPYEEDSISPSGERTLGFHLSSRSAFKEISVRSVIFREERWWSLSGNPIFSSRGDFLGFRGSGTDLTAMRQSEEKVRQLAQFDSLTGLSNRPQMLGILEKTLVSQTGSTRPTALFLLDLDRFKSVNDTLGHPAGDALLKQVSKRLLGVIGSTGQAGRQGGDEFTVVFPGIHDPETLVSIAEKVISSVSRPYMIDGVRVTIGVSIGIAFAPEHGTTSESLIRNADLALYAAKEAGRGIHRFYDKSMHANAEDRRSLEMDLRQALAENQLHLVYQPQVSTMDEEISGYEALVRWEHPVRGSISPSIFIPIAEEAGLISHIGEWVLRTACSEVSKWPQNIKIAVNVSPTQFANPGFPAIVVNALSASRLSANRLELEITESVFLIEGDETDKMFSRLKAIGVRLSLDDFGTGYSSLSYLKKAPFDKIKIDQSFVRGAAMPDTRNAAIIKSIVSLAEALNMETIAEGAETHDELELIKSLGCSHIQGYIYSKPLKAEEAAALLRNSTGMLTPCGVTKSRLPRRRMLRSIVVIHEQHRYEVQIRNMGSRGAMLVGLWHVPEGTELVIELSPRHKIRAVARWSHDDRTGVHFANDIDLDNLVQGKGLEKQRKISSSKAA